MVLSLLRSPFARSIAAPHDIPECGISRGDLLHFDPSSPDVVIHSRVIPTGDIAAAMRQASASSGDLVSAAPTTPGPRAPSDPNGRSSAHLRLIP